MKKKVLSILIIITMLIGTMVILTGCANDSNSDKNSNKIVDTLNEIVKSSVDSWQEKGYAHTFTMSDIQSSLNSKGYKYVIISCGDSEYTDSTTNTKFTESISNYSGNAYSNTRGLESDLSVKNCLVLDTSSNKYYNIEITYKTIKLNSTDKEYPYFQNAKEIK